MENASGFLANKQSRQRKYCLHIQHHYKLHCIYIASLKERPREIDERILGVESFVSEEANTRRRRQAGSGGEVLISRACLSYRLYIKWSEADCDESVSLLSVRG